MKKEKNPIAESLSEIMHHIREFLVAFSAVFITLKVLGIVDWPWWKVLMPIWIPAVIALTVTGVLFGAVYLKIKNLERDLKTTSPTRDAS